MLQEVTLFHVNKFVEKVSFFLLWPWAAAAELEQAGNVLRAKLWDCIIMAYTTAHTGKHTRNCYVGWTREASAVGQLSALMFPAKGAPATSFSNHRSDFQFSGEGGWVCSEFGEFLLSCSPQWLGKVVAFPSPQSAFHRACLHKGVVFHHNNWQLRFLF